jgi:hypothetical protein
LPRIIQAFARKRNPELSGKVAPKIPQRLLAALFVLVAAVSCAPDVYRARVEASAATPLDPTEFSIVRGQRDMDPDSLDFRRYSQALAEELARRGFTPAKTPETSHVFVYLRFGLVGEEVPHHGAGLEHLFVLEVETVDAIALRAGRTGQAGASLWKVTATAHGHLDHRRKVFKVLLAASAPFFGMDGERDVRVHRDPVTGAYEFYGQ